MIFFRLIILFFILISPVKANTIYNLIKIPNLEVYEINTENKLKYFYATKQFNLGVKKNISCLSPDKEILDTKYKIVYKNLNRYSESFLKKINLKYIVLCNNLIISEINTAGIPNHIMKTLILDIEFNEKFFERIIHHEVFHIINDSFAQLFEIEKWKKFNNKDFKYAECSTCNNKVNLSTYENTNGFLTEYSKTIPSEDMAEVFSYLMVNKKIINKKIKNDPILEKKILYIKEKLFKIDNTFKF